ncbi:DUF1801 domain-containing protein [Mucilaginibacter psychrotolerans]|uniref:Uncharacterized protein n=1 Tax=Mucilaginibacter psychrotolerans TaxID=1524096 RepID=A0A4Y8SK83_9SPHI|nr:DUF1801 domain-containing protein [Mucilaginibacter psychrotolerans]TFF38917.1 hypothetical protein E2R66_07920 [Mucilaginibacter psychrotolerans]
MSKDQTTDLLKFMEPFKPETIELALWLRDFAWDMFPDTNELVYDAYNAVAFGWSPTEKLGQVFCNVAIWRTNQNVIFGFNWGSELEDPKKMLIGNGKQFRYIKVASKEDFPKEYIYKLMADAYINSLAKVKNPKDIIKGFTITKSISPVKRELKAKVANKK